MTSAASEAVGSFGDRFDLALVGAGLANGLIAAAVLHHKPDARIAVIEAKSALEFPQTWCFHATDVGPQASVWEWFAAFVDKTWPGYDVAFPSYSRGFDGTYHGITGAHFRDVLERVLDVPNVCVLKGQSVSSAHKSHVVLSDGSIVSAAAVLDGRGIQVRDGGCGYQKFVGWEVQLAPGAEVPRRPVLMDATVDQADGYRFVYVLPLGGQRLLVEDTYFSTHATLDKSAVQMRLKSFLGAQSWDVVDVLRTEQGVLPMPFREPPDEGLLGAGGALQVGYRGGWYQPATGYSLPSAVRVASAVAQAPSLQPAHLAQVLEPLARVQAGQSKFQRLLNRLAFVGVQDDDRRAVFERFYRLPAPLIARFYAAETSWWDRARILGGRPPVPISRFQMAHLMEEAS